MRSHYENPSCIPLRPMRATILAPPPWGIVIIPTTARRTDAGQYATEYRARRYRICRCNSVTCIDTIRFGVGSRDPKQLRKWKQTAYRSNHEVGHHPITRRQPFRHAGPSDQRSINCSGRSTHKTAANVFFLVTSQHRRIM